MVTKSEVAENGLGAHFGFPTSAGSSADDQVELNFGRIWPAHVGALSEFLINSRKAFDGDLDLFLIMAVIGDRTFSARRAPGDITYAEWQGASMPVAPPEDINIQSIADYSGIPRETVRRKLQCLIAREWVSRDDNGFVVATMKSKDDLEALTAVAIRYISKMFALFRSLT
jgi:hypothetical protein